MCGIILFRILNKEKHSKYVAIYNQIRNSVGSRGPESCKDITNDKLGVYISFHRLATYGNLDSNAMMPIIRDEYTLVCNGDIYNYKSLWNKLQQYDPNIQPTTTNDCEVIIPLIKRADENMLHPTSIFEVPNSIRGVFGAIAWNRKTYQLIIMRDPFGVRPLFTVRYGDEFEIYTSDLRVVRLLYTIQTIDKNEIEIEEVKPGSIQRLKIYPFQSTKRFLYKKWYSLPPIPTTSSPIIGSDANNVNHITQTVFDYYSYKLHTYCMNAIKVRIEGATRPFGCLVSGGLDSSLVAGMIRRYLPSDQPLYTYSIGMQGATDEIYAKKVSNYIGSTHTHLMVTEEQMLGAIEKVIGEIGSYDTTTVRASIGNYLICEYIKQKGECVYLFNGDGADELMGGYLYFHNAPDAETFDKECRRLLENIHYFDVLRSDRSIGGNGLAPRTPYLDRAFVDYYLQIPSLVRFAAQMKCEKYLIRHACDPYNYIPSDVLWRTKEAMSDGVSSVENSWHTILQRFIESKLPEPLESYPEIHREHNPPTTKEQLYYRKVFESKYGSGSTHVTPYFWLPRFVKGGATDASARSLSIYDEKIKKVDKNNTLGSDL